MAETDVPDHPAPHRRSRWYWVAGLGAGCLVATALVVMAMRGGDEDRSASDEPTTAPSSPSPGPVPTATATATEGPAPTPTPTAVPTPTPTPSPYADCDVRLEPPAEGDTVGKHATFASAFEEARPGTLLCVFPGRYEEIFEVAESGTLDRPITIRGFGGASVLAVEVTADHVIVENLDVSGRTDEAEAPGVLIDGTGVIVRGNEIHDMVGVGVKCQRAAADEAPRCVDAEIVGNTIWDIDGWGVWVRGDGNRVIGNEIFGLYAATHDDADAFRFFGSNHELRHNYVHDIFESDAGEGRDPHSDCFQTFDPDGSHPALEGIVIAQNVCSVDRHGVVMNALAGPPATDIVVENNIFEINGAAVGLLFGDRNGPVGQIDGLVVANNLVTGTIEFDGVQVHNATRVQITNNLFLGDFEPFAGEGMSGSRGSSADANLVAGPADFADLSAVDVRDRYLPADGSSAIDAGLTDRGPDEDLIGAPRPVDGDGDGQAVTDIGPYEYTITPGRTPEED